MTVIKITHKKGKFYSYLGVTYNASNKNAVLYHNKQKPSEANLTLVKTVPNPHKEK
jgi:hypothetical protein